ncbi:MAG: TMEM165/GDT1 family protein [Methylobacter sp.]|nr:TMEM165/GDT1 family protein [Methylobacter sp.]
MDNLHFYLQSFLSVLTTGNIREISTTTASSFALIAAAEMGDKSQLVCMTLSSCHRALPVMLGAVTAFAFLNTLAMIFGAAIATWLPHYLIAATVSLLFVIFGIHSLRLIEYKGNKVVKEKSSHGIFFTTFLLIAVAEFDDKTPLAVIALSSATVPIAVWLGSTAALASISALGIVTGRAFLKIIPLILLHKISGTIFLILSVFAAYRSYISYPA